LNDFFRYWEEKKNMRINLNNIEVSNVNLGKAILLMQENIGNSGYICLPDAFVLSLAEKDPKLSLILNNSIASFPDGKLLELLAFIDGYKEFKTVSGYFLLEFFLKDTNISHFFYGSNNKTLNKLRNRIYTLYPKANVKGFKEAPYLGIEEIKDNSEILLDIKEISNLSPDILWIGISSPKQDYLMYHYNQYLNNTLLIGIGAVFDYYSGVVKKSPEWMKRFGLRWLYRFFREPARMYRKTLIALIFSMKMVSKATLKKMRTFPNTHNQFFF